MQDQPSSTSRAADVTATASVIIDRLNADVEFYKNALDEKSRACKSYQFLLDDMELRRDRWRFTAICYMVTILIICATPLAFG